MSGGCIFTGLLTNNGNKGSEYEKNRLLNLEIKDLIIHCIPLSTDKKLENFREVGKSIAGFIHPALTPTLCHSAIQLNMKNGEFIIIEYGQYLSKESKLKNSGAFSSFNYSNSSNNPRECQNDNTYYYINKDGARLTIINKKYYKNDSYSIKNGLLISEIIAAQQYGKDIEEFINNYWKKSYKKENDISENFDDFVRVECDIKNKMSLRELCNNFKGEKWEAKNYNVATHNCQTFAAKVIKILKAVRRNDRDKIRTKEKSELPNCIISTLWDNEELSVVNTVGRIPIVGFFYDLYALNHYE